SWTTPKVIENEVVWHSFKDLFQNEDTDILASLKDNEKAYTAQVDDDHGLELMYAKSHVFSYSLLISLIAIIAVVLRKDLAFGRYIAIASLLVQVTGMIMRVYISGRAPITNMYETVMFSGFGALFIAVTITFFRREKLFIIGGLAYNVLCLFMMMFANNMLDSSISPL